MPTPAEMEATRDFIRESLHIEGIIREPTLDEMYAHEHFVALDYPTIGDLVEFVRVYQPNAKLRDQQGMDLFVGAHVPLLGGPAVPLVLKDLLTDLSHLSPFEAHKRYEHLHPFTDCNGRSGRVLWYWHMLFTGKNPAVRGFLHTWYYQSLREGR